MDKRLQTVLAHAGVVSRRRAAELIEDGKVKVDGAVVTEKGFRVDPSAHEIEAEGRVISREEKKYYFLFNKPRGVISTVTDTHSRRKVSDYFKGVTARLYPVGRLDKDTTGILLVTNDGDLTHKLSHPSFEIEKEYLAVVGPRVPERNIRRLEKGIDIEGKRTSPCKIKFVRTDPGGEVYRIILHEGRKRQIRMMFEAAGARVVDLARVRYAGLTLGSLKPGEHRALTAEEVAKLKKAKRGA
ncbi:MAG: pseudouridine synthase [Candidatus Omnitrophota bacterium]